MDSELAPLVLIADDEVNTTIMLQHIFEREGFRVERAHNGQDALQVARVTRPDLILLDILMPGMNGFDVLQQLREHDATATIPTILMTANARQPADVARGLSLGADDYVYKPFAPQELIARAQSKIRSRHLEEALHNRTRELEVLLGASELMNQHLERAELLDLAPSLLLDLLPGQAALVALDEDPLLNARLIGRQSDYELDRDAIVRDLMALELGAGLTDWSADDAPMLNGFACGIVTTLRQGGNRIGRIAICGTHSRYQDNHLRLFGGIIRQIALALHNARLYELQADYATQLELMVQRRTAELESAQKLLVRSEKLASIGHLAASIAHEINNPLMPIRTLLESIVEDLQDRNIDYDAQSVEIIQASIERIRVIVSRLLEFSRDSTGEMGLIDLNDVLEDVVSLNHKFFQHQRIEIVRVAEPLPKIHGSKDQLLQVFMNMTLNAQAAMPEGGRFTIKTYREGSSVVASLSDTGSGISPRDVDKIFDPFFSTKPNGTGLGLFVSHGIVEAHNGTIDVRSERGKGTEFIVRLPIQP